MHDHARAINFGYTNWRGEFAMRRATPIHIFWGSTRYHREPQWLMEAFDHGKDALRVFALVDCDFQARDTPTELVF